MRNFRLTALALASLTVPVAFAQNAPSAMYGELGYTSITVAPSGMPDFKPTALRGIVGYQVTSNFAVEGMLGKGMSDGTGTITLQNTAVAVNLKLDSVYGVYGKVKTDLAPGLEAFGRAGYSKANTTATVSVSGTSISNTGSTDGFSWGVGAAYAVSPGVTATVDYMSYSSKEDGKATGPTFGVSFKF
jgi:opacity protein-like surface antigen